MEYDVEGKLILSEEEREYIIDLYHEEPEDLLHYEVVEAILEYRDNKEVKK